MLRIRRRTTLGATSGVALLATVGAIIFLLTTAQGGAPPPLISLQGVTPEISADLQNSYTILMVPEGDRATVTPADATEKALAEGGGTPLETVLARYVDNGTTPPQDRLVWVVNVDPASVPWYAYATAPVVFYIRVIDAKTGEYVFGYGHTGNCSQVPAKAAGCGTYAPALDTAPSP